MSRWDKIPQKHMRGMEDMKPKSFCLNGRNAHVVPSDAFRENFDRIFGKEEKREPADFDDSSRK